MPLSAWQLTPINTFTLMNVLDCNIFKCHFLSCSDVHFLSFINFVELCTNDFELKWDKLTYYMPKQQPKILRQFSMNFTLRLVFAFDGSYLTSCFAGVRAHPLIQCTSRDPLESNLDATSYSASRAPPRERLLTIFTHRPDRTRQVAIHEHIHTHTPARPH